MILITVPAQTGINLKLFPSNWGNGQIHLAMQHLIIKKEIEYPDNQKYRDAGFCNFCNPCNK